MLLKSKDDIAQQLAQLDQLLRLRLSWKQRADIERERARLQAGAKAEKDAAFEIDFRLKDQRLYQREGTSDSNSFGNR